MAESSSNLFLTWRFIFNININSLRLNAEQLPHWSTEFEVPDVINFEDLNRPYSDAFARRIANQVFHPSPSRLISFPYPKGLRQFRVLAICEPDDLVLLRSAAGHVLDCTRRIVGSNVHSWRFIKYPPAWRFKKRKNAYKDFVEAALRALHTTAVRVMCRTDVKLYYPSVALDVVSAAFERWGVPEKAAHIILTILGYWQQRYKLSGLPIGPEACGVIGNALLVPVDDAIARTGATHHRFMDDFLIFSESEQLCDQAVQAMDSQLTDVDLSRSTEKTVFYFTKEAAVSALRNDDFASLGELLRWRPGIGVRRLHALVDEHLNDRDGISQSEFRWIIRTLCNVNDDYGVDFLVGEIETMNLDPRLSADYIAKFIRGRVAPLLFDHLSKPERTETAAISLHLLRILCDMQWGNAEGEIFSQLATDRSRLPPVRAWAWRALRTTPCWTQAHAMDAAIGDDDSMVRRAAAITLRTSANSKQIRGFAQKLRETCPRLGHTAQWLEAA